MSDTFLEPDPRRRRESFDGVAELYDRFRPGYPPAVLGAVCEAIQDATPDHRDLAGTQLLEIGCGTGQLSVPLAERGVHLTAVELGPSLAAIARCHLAAFPNARVDNDAFEQWQPAPGQQFDALVCASAWHWLDPVLRYERAAELVRPGGALVLVHTHHVQGGTPGFVTASQPSYLRWGLSDDPSFEPTIPDAPLMHTDLDHRPEFADLTRHRFEADRSFTSDEYIGLLETDSLVNGVDQQSRQGFLDDIRQVVDASYDGSITRRYVHEVIAARRR
jgi:SAM-dependent methyltransferase